MQFKSGSISFSSHKGSGPRTLSTTVNFPNNVTNAVAVLSGFTAGYSEYDGDEHLGNLEIKVDSGLSETPGVVNVTVIFGLRDWSSEWDDAYEGIVYFIVLAE
jgi:hypothetical protein